MKKKILLALFVALLGVMVFSNISVSAETYGDLTYHISNGGVAITDCNELAKGEIVIPESIEGYPVTIIGDGAFEYIDGITSVIIPDSVTTIGGYAFRNCEKLTAVTIPDSVITICDYAFNGCLGLATITIPDSVTFIGHSAFKKCISLTDVYYNGTEDERNCINIGTYNDYLINSTIHFMTIGDSDGDGEIDIKDVIFIRRYLTGGNNQTLIEQAADANKDGAVDIRDIIVLRRFIAGGYGIEL